MPLTERQRRAILADRRRSPQIRPNSFNNRSFAPRESRLMRFVRGINTGANKIYSYIPKPVGQLFAMSPMGMGINGTHKIINDFVSPEAAEVADAAINVATLRKPGVKTGKAVYKTGKFTNYMRKGSENSDLYTMYARTRSDLVHKNNLDNPWINSWKTYRNGSDYRTLKRFATRKLEYHYKEAVDNYNKAFNMIVNSPKVYNNPIIKRGIETAMRSSHGYESPMRKIIEQVGDVWNTDKNRFYDIAKYILTGKGNRNGYANSFANKYANTEFIDGKVKDMPNTYETYRGYLSGINDYKLPAEGYGDVIDAGLYGTTIDPNIATEIPASKQIKGVHENYIKEHYPGRNIKYYMIKGKNLSSFRKLKDANVVGTENKPYTGSINSNDADVSIDTGGHIGIEGHYIDHKNKVYKATAEQDIYKFNNSDYTKRYFDNNSYGDVFINSPLRNSIQSAGLQLVDNAFTPVVFRTPFYYNDFNTEIKTPKIDLTKHNPITIKQKYNNKLPFKFGGQTFKSRF